MNRACGVVAAVAAIAAVAASSAQTATPIVSATVQPADPVFGDSFAYVVEATVPSEGSDRVSIVSDVGPFTRVGATHETRTVANGVTRIRVTERIACLTAACLPRVTGKAVVLATPLVNGAGVLAGPPAQVMVRSRVPNAAIAADGPAFRRPTELPAATVRIEPRLAQGVLVVLGLVLVAVGGVLLALAPSHRRRTEARRGVEANSIVRAVRLLRDSTARDATDRRRAAGLASRIAGEPELSLDAAQVAWSKAEPAPPDAATLVDRLEQLVEPTAASGG